MDIEAVRNTLEQASMASLAIGLAIGFFFSSNPVALAVIPVSLAYVTKAPASGLSTRNRPPPVRSCTCTSAPAASGTAT